MEAVGDAEVRVLDLVPADADAGDDPTPRQHVERGELLGQHDRLPLRHDDDARPEPDLRRPPRHVGERQDRIEDPPVVIARRVRGTSTWSVVQTVVYPSRSAASAAASIPSADAPASMFGSPSP